jgi:adenosylhomocysteine nucleosidase
MRAVVHIAARREWRSFCDAIPAASSTPLPIGEYFAHTLSIASSAVELICLRGGVGKIRAAASTQYAICTWQPQLYLVLGTAGAVDPTLNELDLVVATRTLIHDFQLALTSVTANTIVTDHTIDTPIDWTACPFPVPVRPGVIATGDMDVTSQNVARLRTTYGATIADWESGAVALTCALNHIPWIILRGVSDTPGDAPEVQIDRYRHNTPIIMERLWSLLPCILEYYVEILSDNSRRQSSWQAHAKQ